MLMRLDPDKKATAVHVDPARPQGRRSPATASTRSTRRTPIGGPKLAVTTVRSLLNIPINHVVNVNFGGFSRAVKRLGCFYIDVDRRYFNDNNPPAGGGNERYATIDIEPGYQKPVRPGLARLRALPPPRRRLRARRAPAGLPASRPSRRSASASCSPTARSSCGSSAATRRPTSTPRAPSCGSLRLTYEATKTPIREVHFPAGIENNASGSYVTITDENLRKTVRQFLEVRGSTGAGTRKPGAKSSGGGGSSVDLQEQAKRTKQTLAPGLVAAKTRARTSSPRCRRRPASCPSTTPRCARRTARQPSLQPAALHDQRPRRLLVQGLPHRRLRGRERPVLRHAGHELDARRRSSTTPAAAQARRPDAAAVLRRRRGCGSSPGGRAAGVYWVSNTLLARR